MLTANDRRRSSSTDGRVRRGERSKEAIVNALFELVGEGIPEPTAEQVAERASVGIRSVFRHFKDMDTLFGAMDARLEAKYAPIIAAPVPKGSQSQRIDAFIERRATVYEGIAPYKRAANTKRAHSDFLQERHTALARRASQDLRRWFPELKKLQPAVVHALDLVTSFEAWDRLRVEQRLGKKRACAAMECAMRALLRVK